MNPKEPITEPKVKITPLPLMDIKEVKEMIAKWGDGAESVEEMNDWNTHTEGEF